MKQIITLLLALLVFSQPIFSQKKKQIDWKTDLNRLSTTLCEKHYNLFTIKSKDYFCSNINKIINDSKKLDDFQIALRTEQLIAQMGDSHTSLGLASLINKNKILPIHLLWTSDGIHILHTTEKNKEILGAKLLSINKTPISTIIDSINTIYVADNKAVTKLKAPQYIPSLQILEYFGFAKSKQVELTLDDNKTYIITPDILTSQNRVSFKPDSLAFSTLNENVFFTDCYYPNEKIYYMIYNVCYSKELEEQYGNKNKAKSLPSFKEFENKAFDVLAKNPVDKIIFDMRYNGGGNSSLGSDFIEKLAKFLTVNPTVRTYVVIGRKTFSSAIINAMDFKKLTNAIFVGEETAGKPNHFGEIKTFKLPTSGIPVSYSTKYFTITDEDINTITPDIVVEMSFADLQRGIDPIYEWIKNQ